MKQKNKDIIEKQIFHLTSKYYQEVHAKNDFKPGITKIGYSGRVFDQDDLIC